MSIVTGPSASSAARSAGSRLDHPRGRRGQPGLRARASALPVNRRAIPVAVEVARPGTGVTCWPGLIGAHPVQADQEVLPGQLRGGHPGQHLPAGEPARGAA